MSATIKLIAWGMVDPENMEPAARLVVTRQVRKEARVYNFKVVAVAGSLYHGPAKASYYRLWRYTERFGRTFIGMAPLTECCRIMHRVIEDGNKDSTLEKCVLPIHISCEC